MPSETTTKQYESRIAILAKAGVDPIAKPADLLTWFETTKQGNSSKKLYLSAIKWKHGDMFPKVLQDKLNDFFQKQNDTAKEQKLSPNQEKNFVSFDDLAKVQKTLEADHETKFLQYLLVSLYTLTPPVRLDYGDVQVFQRYGKGRKGNELILTSKKAPVFVFRNYKTAKTYGEVLLPIPKPLADVIRAWFIHLGGLPRFLLGKEYRPEQLSAMIQGAFKENTGKEVGVNLLRHAYITKVFPSLTTLKQKDDLAKRMLHSATLQELYNVPE